MKTKRIFTVLVTLILSALIIFSISACDFGGNDDENEDHEHEFSTWSEGFAPTCTQDGVAPHYFCPICAKYFDADKNEIDHVIKTTGHAYGEWIPEISPSCSKRGSLGHYECSVCKKNFDSNMSELQDIEIAKTAHSLLDEYYYDSVYHWRNCSLCGEKGEHSKHDIDYTAGECRDCKKSFTPTEGLVYEIDYDSESVFVVGYEGEDTDIVIAKEYEGYPVKSISFNAFADNEYITSVIIPEGVEYVCESAFSGCSKLEEIIIPDSLKEIGNSAFSYSAIKSIYVPRVELIGNFAFAYCENILVVEIGTELDSLGIGAFDGCTKLREVVNNSKTRISKEDRTVPSGVISVHQGTSLIDKEGDFFFYTLYDGMKPVNYLIAYDGNAKTVTLPEDYNGMSYSVYNRAFMQNNDMINLIIPDGVDSINYQAFFSCENLVSVSLGKNVELIENEAFFGCLKLVEVINNSKLNVTANSGTNGNIASYALEVHTGESKILENDNFVFYVSEAGNYLINYTGRASEITLPTLNGKSYAINDYAFIENLFIEDVTIPDGVTSVGLAAFGYCENLKNVTMTDSVTKIAEDGFTHCYKLQNIRMSENLEELGDYAFYKCEKLQSIVLSDKLSAIGESAFYECDELYAIEFGENLKSIGEYAFFGCDSLLELNFPNGLETVGAESFRGCNSLTTLVIPDSVTSIGSCAFELCYNLIDVSLGSGLTRIENLTFMHCTKLETIVIPEGVTSIGKNAFNDCASLKSIVIPKSVTSIEESAFEYCKNLADVYYLGTEIEWSNNVDRQIGNSYLFDKATLHCQQK